MSSSHHTNSRVRHISCDGIPGHRLDRIPRALMQILLIDDDDAVRLALAAALRSRGQQVTPARDGNEGMRKLRGHRYDVVVSDVKMPGPDGFTILEYAKHSEHPPEVILMTAHGDISDAVSAMKLSAAEYLTKPFSPEELVRCVERIQETQLVNKALSSDQPAEIIDRHGLVGACEAMLQVASRIDVIGPSEAPVLITGESGTGKELVARALHAQSPRATGPFVPINCASFPDSLLEAELFGHERGAFTGADRQREGRFSTARGGTLFLDEISEMNLSCQAKLLRVIQERVFSPLGTNQVRNLDARILSATNRPLLSQIEQKKFREDLYYRVKVMTIDLPPLRERGGDLVPLCAHLLKKLSGSQGPLSISRAAWGLLADYDFPGNVRELEHALQHAVVLARAESSQEILPEHLPTELRQGLRSDDPETLREIQPLGPALRSFERKYLLRAVAMCDGNRSRAARHLNISRKNLWEKLRSQGITDTEIRQELETLPWSEAATSPRE